MTITEQILNLLEINENIPALVINEYANIVATNSIWSKQFGKIESGKSIFNVFDKSTSLLVKSSLIDSKTFLKIKKRAVQFLINGNFKNYQMIISPFKIGNKLYFYILAFNDQYKGNFTIYPTVDDFSYYKKFANLFDLVNSNQEFSKIENDIKDLIEIGKEPIAIGDFSDFKIINESFKEFINPEIVGLELSLNSKLKNSELILILHTCIKESVKNKSIFVIENPFAQNVNVTDRNRIVIFPIDKKEETLIFGKIIIEEEIQISDFTENKPETFSSRMSDSVPTIVYDKNNFEILDINESAVNIYGYEPSEIKSMSFIELFVPDDMQKLLSSLEENKIFKYTQVKKDGSSINVISERESITWESRDAFIEKIKIADDNNSEESQNSNLIKGKIHPYGEVINSENEENVSVDENSELAKDEIIPDEEINERKIEGNETEIINDDSQNIDLPVEELPDAKIIEETNEESCENISIEEIPELTESEENKEIQTEKEEENENVETELKTPLKEPKQETKKLEKPISPFLASLFHELLTPVNVILGFVQEIIDSVEDPTEEQEESAKIIKENQQLLLQTMNMAVQYAKLEENLLPLKLEEFDLKNYLVDLEDSIFKTAETENVKVHFSKLDQLIINYDRQKLLAAISYFIKFIVKLTKSDNVNVSLKHSENTLEVLVKDNDFGISEKVLEDILEIYNSDKFAENNNLGFSQITIKLSKKLNELISAKVSKHLMENSTFLALSIPLDIDKLPSPEKGSKETEEDFEPEEIEENIKETLEEIPNLKLKEEFSDDQLAENDNQILIDDISEKPVGILEEPESLTEIDDKIIEDYGEEEIEFIESTPVEDKENVEFNVSELTCLFIDDSVDTQLLFKSQMADFKDLTICNNFTEAIPIIQNNNFDIIYVDINLNDIYNGFDALKIIRQLKNYKSTPVIAVTAYSFDGDKDKFINFGFTDYIVKPLFKNQLVESLEKTLF